MYLPEANLKILIDSGASNSIINSNIAFQYLGNYIFKKPFVIKSLNKTVYNNKNVRFPLLQELGVKTPLEFHVVDWHDRYDALIGSQDLTHLGVKLDFSNRTLTLNGVKIPFHFQFTNNSLKRPVCSNVNNVITIPVNIEEGEVILPEIKINNNISSPEAIVYVKEGLCQMPVDTAIEVNFQERIEVTPINQEDIKNPKIPKMKKKISELIRTNHLNSEEQRVIINLCKQYSDVFYYEDCNLSFTSAVKHFIRTKDEEPVFVKSFRHPHAMKQEIQAQIQKLLDNKIIQPSISPYSAPVWVIPKKLDASGKRKYRMVIDYRKLNEKTIEDKYPLPRIEEILDNLGKCLFHNFRFGSGFSPN